MRLTPENYAVSDLIDLVEAGELALPEFQRSFIWRPLQIAELLRTFARRWPAGTFLLLAVEGSSDFALKPIASAPPLTVPRLLILDGQQRTTALYQALTDRAPEMYFLKMKEVLDTGGFEDDHLEYRKRSRFVKDYPSLKEMAADRVVPVHVMLDDSQWQKWLRYVPTESEQDQLVETRKTHLPGFKDYDMPVVRLPDSVPLAAIAKIFETLNKTGTPLATFDLMVARLYPSDFLLRDEWADAREVRPELVEFGLDKDKDGVEMLKVIALRENIRQKNANVKVTIKGVRESDVLGLPPDTVINNWGKAADAYAVAVQFVKERCGVVRHLLLPSQTMLLPLAHVLGGFAGELRHAYHDDLVRWFWATSFSQTYAQGANTQAVSDARSLAAWNQDADAIPPVIRNFRLDSDLFKDGRRRNEMLLRGLLCLSVTLNARDWIKGDRFRDATGPLEFHHIYPDDYLKAQWQGDPDPLANFSLLLGPTNASLRNTLPKDVLERKDVQSSAVASNLIDLEWFAKEDDPRSPQERIEAFVDERARKLEALCYEAVGVEQPRVRS